MLDAAEAAVGQDATIGGYAYEAGRVTILCVNKWDLASNKDKALSSNACATEMKFLEYAPVAFMSAARRQWCLAVVRLDPARLRSGHPNGSRQAS